MKAFLFELGDTARDLISGYEGVIIGRAEHVTGCNTYGLLPKSKDGKTDDPKWFDGQRLVLVKGGAALRKKLSIAEANGAGPNPVTTSAGSERRRRS